MMVWLSWILFFSFNFVGNCVDRTGNDGQFKGGVLG